MLEIRQLFIAKTLDESLLCKLPGENICRLRANKSTDFILHSFYYFIPNSHMLHVTCTQIENGPKNEYRYFALESPCGMSSPNLFNFQHTRVCTLASSTCTTCLYFPFSIIQVYFVVNNRRKVILLNSDMFLDRPKVTKLCLNIQNFV